MESSASSWKQVKLSKLLLMNFKKLVTTRRNNLLKLKSNTKRMSLKKMLRTLLSKKRTKNRWKREWKNRSILLKSRTTRNSSNPSWMSRTYR
jgi:hypothetical protein